MRVLDRARDYGYAAGWQIRHALNRRGATTLQTGTETPVLLIPGVWETWQFLRPVAERLHARGHPVHVVDDLGYNRGGVAEMAAITERYLRRHDLSGVVIVAHSKGGLIGKHVMLGTEGDRIDRMIAIATPFAGSAYANYLPVRALRAFRPTDQTILLLGEGIAANDRIVSIYPEFDPHIPAGSFLAGARNIELPIAGHFRILSDPLLLRAVLANLTG